MVCGVGDMAQDAKEVAVWFRENSAASPVLESGEDHRGGASPDDCGIAVPPAWGVF
jgi:hypothetical protein